jgi:hypothetical protein
MHGQRRKAQWLQEINGFALSSLFEWLTIGTFGAINGGHYSPCGVSPKGWLAAPSKMSISWLDLPRLPTAFIMSQHPTIKEVLPVMPIFPTGSSEW